MRKGLGLSYRNRLVIQTFSLDYFLLLVENNRENGFPVKVQYYRRNIWTQSVLMMNERLVSRNQLSVLLSLSK